MDTQITQIANSIEEFGFTNPVLIDENSTIIAGHGRVQAAKKLGLTDVPCIRLSFLDEAQRKAYIIADNKIALNAGWDENMLKLEIEELQNLDYDIDVLGFDPSELNFDEIDYSILDEEDLDEELENLSGNIRKAIQIEFEPEHFAEATAVVKYWRDAGAYVGMMIMEFLKREKDKQN